MYEEKASGSKLDRVELENCLKSLRKGDELVIWKLDRLGRSLSQLINIIEEIREKDVELSVITENIDHIDTIRKNDISYFCHYSRIRKIDD
ncbi:recombinase family protein [Bathymodiolus japonicus methanotrophic gill symbiont]|uniref:recombinase family protein n=1 Tax=Bathymodiolus japonicus methanotrophic gill symbiont TaxID=113269 RepID=UPI003B8334BE